jgi:hypothetical protein
MATAPNAYQLAARNPQRTLVIGGTLLILAGLIFGQLFSVFIVHPNGNNIGQSLFAAAQSVSSQQAEAAMGHIQQVGHYLENHGTKVDAHNHTIQFGYLALLMAMAMPVLALSEKTKSRMAWLAIAGGALMGPSVFAIHYVGLAYSPFESIGWASVVTDIGCLFVLSAVTICLYGFIQYTRGKTLNNIGCAPLDCKTAESRMLLQTGAVMLLSSFIFGALYAANTMEQIAVREVTALKDVLTQAMASNMDALGAAFGEFASAGGERNSKIAAHAHMNNLGVMVLFLAFIQPYVYLNNGWRKRWVKVLITGAIALPVLFLLEIQWGVVIGGAADIAGVLVTLGMLGMLFGLLRHTGSVDSQQENAA